MPAYYFRVIHEGKPNGWIGFACVESKDQLYFAIDEYCDPYSVEIKSASTGSYIRLIDEDEKYTTSEFSEYEEDIDSDGWRDPKWKPLDHYYRR
jgi:hypothetical protein